MFRKLPLSLCSVRHGTIFHSPSRASTVRNALPSGFFSKTGNFRIRYPKSRAQHAKHAPLRLATVRFHPQRPCNMDRLVLAPASILPFVVARPTQANGYGPCQCATPAATLSSTKRPSRNRSSPKGAARTPGSSFAINSAIAHPEPGMDLKPPVPHPQLI